MDIRSRLEKIIKPEDVDKQIRLAKQYSMRLKSQAKSHTLTLDEKIETLSKHNDAESTLRQLRRLCWDVDDALAEGKLATSVLS